MSNEPPADGPSLDRAKLAAARLWATHRYPYMASAVFAAPVLPAPDLGRLMIDRHWRVHADPAAVADASVEELGGELLHLSLHLLRDHAGRGDGAALADEAELHHWVEAADAEIHDDFPADLARIEPAVRPADLDLPEGRLAEEYYRRGSVRPDSVTDCGSGAHGRVAGWEPPPPAPGEQGVGPQEQALLRRQVAAEVARTAADQASASLRRWADDTLAPSTDWRRRLGVALRRSLTEASGAVDYSYRRPSRRAAAVGNVVLASLRRPNIEVAVVCDTSASVDDDQLALAVAEVDGILRATGTRSVTVLSCDSAVGTVTRAARGRDVVLTGGGGTEMGVGIEAASGLRPRPAAVIVLTDGFTAWPVTAPDVDLLVGLLPHNHPVEPPTPPSWVRTVRIEDERRHR